MSQEDIYTWQYNGHDFELDLEDRDTAIRFEKAVDKADEAIRNVKKDGNLSDAIKQMCDAYYTFFDELFGAGTSTKLFEGKYNTRLCESAYFDSLIPFARKQTNYINNRQRQRLEPQNRQQRRFNNKRRDHR